MEISRLDKQEIISTLTFADLEVIVTQIVQRIISQEAASLIPNKYRQEIPFNSTATPFWQIIVENSSKVPEEIWDSIPSNASENLDAYL
ncbi:hypothetical protein V2H45_13335 [Tumidithrix elongata RA019]|uniref:Uncharacterized protein n=1 Tax=Tumidithrix elongata BACA0141 TaxID=2716417 RepID=A0AAW9Q4G9_9CYAN|nr:hypothetical protein [Tumidithrix elongata RA019]